MIVKRIFQLDWEFCGVLFADACVFYNGFVLQKSIIFIFSLPITIIYMKIYYHLLLIRFYILTIWFKYLLASALCLGLLTYYIKYYIQYNRNPHIWHLRITDLVNRAFFPLTSFLSSVFTLDIVSNATLATARRLDINCGRRHDNFRRNRPSLCVIFQQTQIVAEDMMTFDAITVYGIAARRMMWLTSLDCWSQQTSRQHLMRSLFKACSERN